MHPGAVLRHQKTMHEVEDDSKPTMKFKCTPPCNFSCARADHLKQHLKPNNKQCLLNASRCPACHDLIKGSMKTHARSCRAKFLCDDCTSAFPSKSLLINHRNDAHPDCVVVVASS